MIGRAINKIRYNRFVKKMGGDKDDVNYRCHASSAYQFVYVETPKVACTTIKAILQSAEGRDVQSLSFDEIHCRSKSPLKAPIENPALFLAILNSKSARTFTFVRNPYTRLLSAYIDKIAATNLQVAVLGNGKSLRKVLPPLVSETPLNAIQRARAERLEKLSLPTEEKVSFEQFVNALKNAEPITMDAHWRPQHLLTMPQHIQYDFIGKFENLCVDISTIASKLGITAPSNIAKNPHKTNATKKVEKYYTENLKKIVNQIYDQDFEIFDYDRTMSF